MNARTDWIPPLSASLLLATVALAPMHAQTSPRDSSSGSASAAAQRADESDILEQPRFEVVGERDRLPVIGGSADTFGAIALEQSRVVTVNEALRRVPGVVVRDEEGFGLRPNIGLRGLNPTRTTKLTLLEDAIPLAYAPYGDNASYYHPPVDRYVGIEVLKGAHSLLFGPQTIGGVINYLTPDAPRSPSGFVQASIGNRSFLNAHLRVGGRGALLDYTRKQGDGARENLEHEIDDLNLKYTFRFADRHTLTLRANYYTEDSQVTYSGLTLAEYQNLGARYNPFENDGFDITRTGISATHRVEFSESADLTTNLYHSEFDRDWWRQSSNSQDGQHGAGAVVWVIDGVSATFLQHRLAGRRVDPSTQFASAQGRLRAYDTTGIESRYSLRTSAGEFQTGLKLHREEQNRRQINGNAPTARTGTLAEDNFRKTDAWSVFAAHRFELGSFALTPIARYEAMDFDRLNRLTGVAGTASVDRFLPGLGATWRASDTTTLFAGIHRGFAPPRVEDLIGGAGTVTDVDAEKSLNSEIGVRADLMEGVSIQAALFRQDFDNLIAVGSIAGGGTPLSQGEAVFEGAELGVYGRFSGGFRTRLAYTNVFTARQASPFVNVASKIAIPGSVAGNRQPYAPRHTLTAAIGYTLARVDAELEAQYIGEHFTDFANTVAASADGQRGVIEAATVWNATVNFRATDTLTLFATGKNLADKTYITDRTRGIVVGMPRLVQFGARFTF
ncbi:TonB-dependent receptor family protein [Opitutales bacterium ASA1]|uniref:TonB-dependent receptor family protein n=1 Tax=Congregicoccus parvus TaxID=3081749 RepID=UPI002B2F3701|nr:TonB-dependent receptor family protein [Opitutales bacterium ASA1]